MPSARPLALALALAALTTAPAPAQPAPNAAPGCAADIRDAYQRGYVDGVDAVKAQLAQATARMQQQVQDQLNAQLAQTQAQSAAELDTRIAAAQENALSDQTPGPAARMPSLSGTIKALDTRRPTPDPAALPPGATITITDPQNLPPELYRALMDYVKA